MLIKTSDLTGAALDWAVTLAQGIQLERSDRGGYYAYNENHHPRYSYLSAEEADDYEAGFISPSTDWAQGGPIIEREFIDMRHIRDSSFYWEAWTPAPEYADGEASACGPTPLIAAMRCYVASKLGDTVEIPDDLL